MGNAVHNAAYDARRARVSAYVRAHHGDLIAEIEGGGGPHVVAASDLALVPANRRAAFLRQMAKDIAIYRNDAEALTVAFMVHGP